MEVTVLSFDGQIDDFPALIQAVDGLLANGVKRLAIDLHGLPFINSAALGYLVKANKQLAADAGEMALCRLQPALIRIFEMTQLDQLFPTFQDVEEAVAYLGGDPTRPITDDEDMGGPLSRRQWAQAAS